MSHNRQLAVNMIASFISCVIVSLINFFLSPYIVSEIGIDAYGFITLGNNFISYMSLLTIAINSLAGRFISIQYFKKKYEETNIYFSSVFYANLLISIVLLFLSVIIWILLDRLINIPEHLYWDIKILFASLFINFIINTITSVFSVATFVTNKLYLSSIRGIEVNIIKVALLVLLFTIFAPKVCYIGIVGIISGSYIIIYNLYYTKKFLPFLRIKTKHFNISIVKKIFFSGIWNLITQLGVLLNEGLDLLITNIMINPVSMGVLSISKIIPSFITMIIGNLVGIFSPNFTQLYAENKKNELIFSLKQAMKIMGIIANLPIIVLIVCGKSFFMLWQPTQDAETLHILSIIICAGFIFNGGVNCIYDIFIVVNKLKVPAISVVITGILNIIIVYILLETTDLGIFAIAGISTCLNIVKNLVLNIPYSAKCLNLKWYAFYADVVRPIVFVSISSLLCFYLFKCINIDNNWENFILSLMITLTISILIALFIVLRKDDRLYIHNLIYKLLRKNG